MRYSLQFKYSTSRARDTYGYNLVTLYVDGVKVARECGGGYDMQGAALGQWVQNAFQSELIAMSDRAHAEYPRVNGEHTGKNRHYSREERPALMYGMALITDNGNPLEVTIDGACGWSSVRAILDALGFEIIGVTRDVYTVETKREEA
jgi:hypothetical protein